jgi:1-acyl-sn-glycerol-3-phosphate acyltransferase
MAEKPAKRRRVGPADTGETAEPSPRGTGKRSKPTDQPTRATQAAGGVTPLDEKPAKRTATARVEPAPANQPANRASRRTGVAGPSAKPAKSAKSAKPAKSAKSAKSAKDPGNLADATKVVRPPGGARRSEPSAKTKQVRPTRQQTGPVAPGAPMPATGKNATVTTPVDELLKIVAEFATRVFGSDGDERAEQALEFLRRRLTGDYEVDAFGFDEQLTDTVLLPVLRLLYRHWFRVDVKGIENVPAGGAALIVANHSGTIPLDSLMTEVAVHDEHPAHRHLRMLGADLVFQLPFLADVARKNGTTLACNEDTERLLAAGELVGVWPEGFKGIGKPFSERYKLQRFGRGGFVSAAIRAKAPIIPCAIVGAEETYPMIANLGTVARMIGVPYVPITPTFPWLGPLGLIPLPSKWMIEFGEPITTAGLEAGAADDPMLVFELTDRVRETIQQTLYALLVRRRSTFF